MVDLAGRWRGYRWRVVAGMVSAVVASLLLLGVTSVLVAGRELTANARRDAVRETGIALTLIEDLAARDPASLAGLDVELRGVGDFEVVALVDGEQVRTDPGLSLAAVPEALRVTGATIATATTDTPQGAYLVTSSRAPNGVDLFLFFPQARLREDVESLTGVVAGTALATSVVMLAWALWATRRVLRPIDETAAAARQLAGGVLGARVSVGTGTFTDLGDAFNDMARALQETVERLSAMEGRQRQFVADVAHELRTPLTALVTAADLLEPAIPSLDRTQRRAAETLVEETRRLQQLVLDLMEISRLDAAAAPVERVPVDVGRLLTRLVASHPRSADCRLDVVDGPVASADARRVHAIVRNLVDNAFEHGRPPVDVRARPRDRLVEIEVADHGDGVPAALREQVFERFVKGDPARARAHGSGLGLGIARDNARVLGGDVVLAEGGGAGARFVVTLPAADGSVPGDGDG